MSFPDTEYIANEIQEFFPLAAERLRQYAKLSQTQEKLIRELQSEKEASATEKEKISSELKILKEEKQQWLELPSVKERLVADAIARRDEAIAQLEELRK